SVGQARRHHHVAIGALANASGELVLMPAERENADHELSAIEMGDQSRVEPADGVVLQVARQKADVDAAAAGPRGRHDAMSPRSLSEFGQSLLKWPNVLALVGEIKQRRKNLHGRTDSDALLVQFPKVGEQSLTALGHLFDRI